MGDRRIGRDGRIIPATPTTRNPGGRAWHKRSLEQRRRVPYCEQCGATTNLDADHIVPLSMGGRMAGPLRTLCQACNR